MYTEVFFDIETQKLFDEVSVFDPSLLGVSLVSVYQRQINNHLEEISGQMFSFWEHQLTDMWPLFTNADRIIGFNSLGFDVPALSPLCPYNFKKLNHFDIMDKVKQILGFRIGLDALASQTLGKNKTDIGTNAVLYWQKHDPQSLQKLQSYCEADVAITRDLYHHALKGGELKFRDKWNSIRSLTVDFSYPVTSSSPNSQMGLF